MRGDSPFLYPKPLRNFPTNSFSPSRCKFVRRVLIGTFSYFMTWTQSLRLFLFTLFKLLITLGARVEVFNYEACLLWRLCCDLDSFKPFCHGTHCRRRSGWLQDHLHAIHYEATTGGMSPKRSWPPQIFLSLCTQTLKFFTGPKMLNSFSLVSFFFFTYP